MRVLTLTFLALILALGSTLSTAIYDCYFYSPW